MGGAPSTAAARPATTSPQTTPPRRRPDPPRESGSGYDSSDRYGLRANTRVQRRPERETEPERQPTRVAEVATRWAGAPYPAQQTAPANPPAARVQPVPAQTIPEPATSNPVAPATTIMTTSIPASEPARQPGGSLGAIGTVAAADTGTTAAPADPPEAASSSSSGSLADIAAVVDALPQDARGGAARNASSSPRTSQAQTSQPASPSRHWVQVAGGIDRASLPREFARLRAMAPDQLGGRTAFTAPMRSTSRLLVGPFASAREAQEFVTQLATRNVAAFAWTSAAGQEIQRLAAR